MKISGNMALMLPIHSERFSSLSLSGLPTRAARAAYDNQGCSSRLRGHPFFLVEGIWLKNTSLISQVNIQIKPDNKGK